MNENKTGENDIISQNTSLKKSSVLATHPKLLKIFQQIMSQFNRLDVAITIII